MILRSLVTPSRSALALLATMLAAGAEPALRELSSVPEDLVVPEVVSGPPAPGRRVRLAAPGFEDTAAHHTLHLPADWKPGGRYPVLFEYPGNGGYSNPKLGDSCDGTVEGCSLGFGLGGGVRFIWVCLPFVEVADGTRRNSARWWGDAEETVRYCHAAIDQTCARFGGDASALILCGFSRGSIGCNFIGLQDDRIAARWRAFFCHSHYDGVRTTWPYPGADRPSALGRLRRLGGRPQFICMERSTKDIEDYLRETGVAGDFTFVALPFPNHSDRWILRDIPERRVAREWLARVLQSGGR